MAMVRIVVAAALAVALLAPAGAHGKVVRSGHYVKAFYPDRLSRVIGFIPVTIGGRSRNVEIKVGQDVYRGPWKSFTISRKTTSEALKFMTRDARGRYGDIDSMLFADRPLTTREKRTWRVAADIARDADVLAVAKSHPACAKGLTAAQARDVAAGRVTRWTQVGAGGADVPDSIRLNFAEQDVFERRFGTTRAPAGARRSPDAGLAAAAGGDRSVAVVSSWSRLRRYGSVCAVPLAGIAPTDATVHALDYPGAYAMTLVVNRRPQRTAYERAKRKAYLAYLLSEQTGKRWKATGLLLASEQPASPAPSSPAAPPASGPAPSGDAYPAPTADAQGRPITATRDDDGVRASLAGERFDFTHSGGTERYAFDPGDALHMLTFAGGGGCSQLDGTWHLLAGWRYPEHGGGTMARVHISAPGTSGEVTIDMPGDAMATAYWNGQPYSRSRQVSGTC